MSNVNALEASVRVNAWSDERGFSDSLHGIIGGDFHTAWAAISDPLRMLGQQPLVFLQNAATSRTMFNGQMALVFTLINRFFVPICPHCLNCTEFGQLILKKILNIVATICHILRLKCITFDLDPAGGA